MCSPTSRSVTIGTRSSRPVESRILWKDATRSSRNLRDMASMLVQRRCDTRRSERSAFSGTSPRKDHLRGDVPEKADRKSTRLNSSHGSTSYAVFSMKKKLAREWKKLKRGQPAIQGICRYSDQASRENALSADMIDKVHTYHSIPVTQQHQISRLDSP